MQQVEPGLVVEVLGQRAHARTFATHRQHGAACFEQCADHAEADVAACTEHQRTWGQAVAAEAHCGLRWRSGMTRALAPVVFTRKRERSPSLEARGAVNSRNPNALPAKSARGTGRPVAGEEDDGTADARNTRATRRTLASSQRRAARRKERGMLRSVAARRT